MSPFQQNPTLRRLLGFGGFAVLLGLLLVGLYGDLLLGFKTLFFRDFGVFGYPLAFHHREAFWHGEVALWNPYNGCGMPFLAQWNTMVLYPGALIYLLLPLPWGLNLFMVLHLAWAGLGMYSLAWRWSGDRLGACIAGFSFALGGLLANSMMWPNNMAAFAWMPWVIATLALASTRGRIWVFHAAILGAIQMLTGAPEIILMTWGMAGILHVFQRKALGWRRFLRGCGYLTVASVCVALLAAPQIFPFLELLLKHSHRALDFERPDWSISVGNLGNFILPLFRTLVTPGGMAFYRDQSWTNSFYPGILVSFLGICSLWMLGSARVRGLWLLALLGFWLATGKEGGLVQLVEQIVPPLEFVRYPVKYIVLTIFALPLLAAFGVRWWFSFPVRRRVAWTGWLLLALFTCSLVALLVSSRVTPAAGELWVNYFQSAWTRWLLLLVSVGGLWVLSLGRMGEAGQRLAVALVLGSLAVDLASHQPDQNPRAENRILAPIFRDSPYLQPVPRLGQGRAMARHEAVERVWTKSLSDVQKDFLIGRLALAGNLNLIDQVPQVQGFFSLYCRQFIELDALLKQAENRSNGGLLDLVGVTQTTKPGSDFDWVYRPGAESWVSIPKQVRVCGAEESRAALLQEDYRPADVAWVDSGDISESVPSTEIKGRVSQGAFSTQSLQLQLEMDEAGLVRIAQMHYPYWRASVDGRNTEVLQVDLGLQAVWVPEGRHLLELRYRDNLFLLGLLFSLASAGLCWLKTQPLARKSRRLNLSS